MTRVLVTGYGGFLGAEVARQLMDAGYQVRGIARRLYPELQALGVQGIEGDISDRNLALDVCRDCDAVVHTAAKAGVWGPWNEYYRINTLATSHLLEASHSAGVRAFVHTSSPCVTFDGQDQSGVDENVPYPKKWLCSYQQSKALAEQSVLNVAHRGRLATCALRPHLIWGQGDPHLFPRVIQRAQQGRLRRVGEGTNLIDVVHVSNAARAHVQAVDKLLAQDEQLNGQVLFLSDGKPEVCWDWISRILQSAGVAVPQRSISMRTAYRLGAILEAAYTLLRVQREPPMTRFVAAQLARDHYFNIERARRLLGYAPCVDVDQEFERCQPWLQGLASGSSRHA